VATTSIHIAERPHPSQRYEALPPWLLSMMVHMLAVIALGLMHISLTPGNNLQLAFLQDDHSGDNEAAADNFADLDVAIQADAKELATLDNTQAPIPTTELLTSLETDWQDLISREGGASLVGGLGDGALAEGYGKKNGQGTTSFFGLAGEGGKFVYVFDRSASMLSTFTLYSEDQLLSTVTPLHCAKVELARSLNALSKNSQFQMVFYNHAPWIYGDSHYADQLLAATDENKEHATEFIENLQAEGFTNHLLALDAAISLEPDVIFLLTDGEAKDDLHPNFVRRMSKYCQRKNIVINIVHFSNSPRPECTLIPLAEKSGGQHIFLSLESLAESMIEPVAMKGF
jgi:hypothetical protein